MENQTSIQWARLPKSSGSVYGLKRGYLYRLINAGKIRAKKLSADGTRGITMIHLGDLEKFIEGGQAYKPKVQP